MNIKKYDDDFSSDDSYCFLDNNNADDIGAKGSYLISKGDQLEDQNKPKNPKPEASAKSISKEPLLVEEGATVSYNGIIVRIYSDSHSQRKDRCFFFEPVVFLESDSIAAESNKLLKQDFVRFKIKMWDAGIRSKVLGRLRSLPSLMKIEIHEEDVNVVPYKEVQLVVNSGSIQSIRLADHSSSYDRLDESLHFHFKCDSPSEAEELAENLRKDPQLIVAEWKFSLECRDFPGRPNCSFNVKTLAFDYAESDAIVPGNRKLFF